MNNIYTTRDQFKQELRRLRAQAGMTVRELSERAGICQSLISAYEVAEKSVSSESAAKLADAMALKGFFRNRFLLLAASTKRRDRLVGYSRDMGAAILNFIPHKLREAGIDLNAITDCDYRDTLKPDLSAGPDRLEIQLRGGKRLICDFTVAEDRV